MSAATDKQLHILLVEDDEVDVMNVRRAFKKNNIANPLHVASNGLEALEMLRSPAMAKERRLILLDLNLPDDGKFVLALKRGEGGRWLIMADIDNSIRRRPPATCTSSVGRRKRWPRSPNQRPRSSSRRGSTRHWAA